MTLAYSSYGSALLLCFLEKRIPTAASYIHTSITTDIPKMTNTVKLFQRTVRVFPTIRKQAYCIRQRGGTESPFPPCLACSTPAVLPFVPSHDPPDAVESFTCDLLSRPQPSSFPLLCCSLAADGRRLICSRPAVVLGYPASQASDWLLLPRPAPFDYALD